MGECVPRSLSDAVFALCSGHGGGGGNGNGNGGGNGFPRPGGFGGGGSIGSKEVFTLLVLITRGTQEEKIKCEMRRENLLNEEKNIIFFS